MNKKKIIENAKTAQKETEDIEFKEKFDINSHQDWCEIIKDIIAIANSGEGCIIFGIKDDATPSGFNITHLLKTDPSKITDQIVKYTGLQFSAFDIQKIKIKGRDVVALIIGRSPFPIVFINPGTYDIGKGKQKMAFAKGTVYFRHGAKSEPGNSQDLQKFIEREIKQERNILFRNIRKVAKAPTDYMVKVLPPKVVESKSKNAKPIRIVSNPNAPAYRKIAPDKSHPYRLKELVNTLNEKLKGEIEVKSYDIQCVRKIYKIDNKPKYYYKSKFASPQYSDDFVQWIIRQFKKNNSFFNEAKIKCKKVS